MPIHNLGAMMDWENGELDHEDTVKLFQNLVDTGLAWQLQGMYGRQAQRMLDAGEIHHPYNFRVDDSMVEESGFESVAGHDER